MKLYELRRQGSAEFGAGQEYIIKHNAVFIYEDRGNGYYDYKRCFRIINMKKEEEYEQ